MSLPRICSGAGYVKTTLSYANLPSDPCGCALPSHSIHPLLETAVYLVPLDQRGRWRKLQVQLPFFLCLHKSACIEIYSPGNDDATLSVDLYHLLLHYPPFHWIGIRPSPRNQFCFRAMHLAANNICVTCSFISPQFLMQA